MVRGERRSDLNLLITEENADVARDFVRQALKCRICPSSARRLTRCPNGEVVILRIRNAVNTDRHAFPSWLPFRCQRLRSGPNRWQGYRFRTRWPFFFRGEEHLDSA